MSRHTRKHMTGEGTREDRIAKVARLRLRMLSTREIHQQLEASGVVNPDTGNPWSLGQVISDCRTLVDRWRDESLHDITEHVAQQLAELDEVKRQAWAKGKLDVVLRALQEKAKLLGLYAPEKRDVRVDGRATLAHQVQDLSKLSDDELEQYERLALKATED